MNDSINQLQLTFSFVVECLTLFADDDSFVSLQEKLLSKLEESELEPSSTQEDECVICITSRATMKTMPCKSLNKYSMSEPLMTILRAFFRWSSSRLPALLREDNSKCRCPETVAAALRDMPSTYQPSDVRFWHMENRGVGQQLQCGKQKLERKD